MDIDEKVMRTVITKILAVIDNQLRCIKRHVRLVGEKQHFEIEIKQFKNEPRCLCLCNNCEHARIAIFGPKNCENIDNIRSKTLSCSKNENIWQESACRIYSSKYKTQ